MSRRHQAQSDKYKFLKKHFQPRVRGKKGKFKKGDPPPGQSPQLWPKGGHRQPSREPTGTATTRRRKAMVDFNPESFLEAQVEDELSTSTEPCPEGTHPGQINDVDAKTIEITKGERAGESAVVMSVIWDILDDAIRAQLDRPNVRVKQDFFLELDAAGQISTEKGKNVRLGRMLEALGLNGKKWSPRGLIGQTAMIRVSHRADKNDPTIKYPEVANVAPMK